MTDDRRKQILDMIAKLSNITSEHNAFQGEINNAAAKIQELMDKYFITSDEVERVRVDKETDELKREFESKSSEYVIKGIVRWHWELAGIIASMTHTRDYARTYKREGTFVFFGEAANTEVATNLFVEWVQVIEMMAISALDDYWKVVMKKYDYKGWLKNKKESGYDYNKFMDTVPYAERTTYYKASWLQGCIDGIWKAVRDQEDARSKETTSAIVLYDKKVNEAYAELSKTFSKGKVSRGRSGHSASGYDSGYETGKGLNLTSKRIGN